MLKFYTKIIIIVILLNNPLKNSAQIILPWHETGLFSGASGYIGDLNPNNYFKVTNPIIGLIYRYNFNDRNAIKLAFTYTQIQADDKNANNEWQKKRNLNFFSPITEINIAYEINFFEYNPLIYQNLFITPYLSMGIGAFKFDPQTTLNGKTYHLRDYGTEGQGWDSYDNDGNIITKGAKKYSLYSISIPLGFGVKLNLSKKINIFTELNYKFTLTDYLDDVSTRYAHIPTNSINGEIANDLADRSPEIGYDNNIVGSQRGDSSKKDAYMFVIIGITLNFGVPECLGPL